MTTYLTVDDLTPFADIDGPKAQAMIDDAVAMAVLAAPCITSAEFLADESKMAALKAILRGAVLRWDEAGSGAVTQKTAGPFQQSIDTSKPRRAMFWPSEVDQLRNLCTSQGEGGAFSVDTAPWLGSGHLPWCSLMFGATYCSCGTDIAGEPIYELS